MSALIDALTALGQKIAASGDPELAAHLKTVDDHLAKLDASEGANEATIADTNAGLQAFVAAANGAPAPAPVAADPAPTANAA